MFSFNKQKGGLIWIVLCVGGGVERVTTDCGLPYGLPYSINWRRNTFTYMGVAWIWKGGPVPPKTVFIVPQVSQLVITFITSQRRQHTILKLKVPIPPGPAWHCLYYTIVDFRHVLLEKVGGFAFCRGGTRNVSAGPTMSTMYVMSMLPLRHSVHCRVLTLNLHLIHYRLDSWLKLVGQLHWTLCPFLS